MSAGRRWMRQHVIALVLLTLVWLMMPQAALHKTLAAESDGAAESETEDVAVDEPALTAQSASVSDPRVVVNDSMDAGQVTTWDCVWLGSYPQTYVDDATLVAELDAATGWDDDGDLSYNGQTYRRLSESDATSDNQWHWSGKVSPAGWCYFRWEPIKWRVLEVNGGTALVVADVALDVQKYNETNARVTWSTCTLRSWLNSDFWSDFLPAAQRDTVLTTTLANDDSIRYSTTGGEDTSDRVFLLAESDVWSSEDATRHGFVTEDDAVDEARGCKTSDYALAMGAENRTALSDSLYTCVWWLRSPGAYEDYAACVNDSAQVSDTGWDVDHDKSAVRPALTIYLSSPYVSWAGIVSSDETVNEPVDEDGAEGISDPRVVENNAMVAGQLTTWDCVWLGSYPQTYVDDAALALKLDSASGWDDDGDLSYNGQTYRRLSESDATYSPGEGWYGSKDWNWSDKASPAGWCYYRWEPIKWRVLEVNGDSALVVADVGLDDQKYSSPRAVNNDDRSTWETCALRSWLNGYGASSNKPEIDYTSDNFIDTAFSPAELGAIQTTHLTNADNSHYNVSGGNGTIDRVFLLSESDVWNGADAARHGFTVSTDRDEARFCKASDYARSMGASIDTSDEYRGNATWWLRSPGYRDTEAAGVGTDGIVDYSGDGVGYYLNTVRPALTLNLSSTALSYAGTVSSDGTVRIVGGGGDDADSESEAMWAAPVLGSFTTNYKDAPRTFSGEKGFVYKDAYFIKDATIYNHSLATMSLCMAFSAYGLKPYESYDVNIKDLMHKCGFAGDGRYKAYYFNEVPSMSSIACAIGSKDIRVDGQDYTLIAVAVRGGGYEDEWASNFDVGSSGDHGGFDWSAEKVKSYIIDYIGENKIVGNVKIWITGFSRGAAVATHTAAKLDDLAGFAYEDDSSESGYVRVEFNKESIYAYGFATPAGACKASNPHGSNYGNIWNVIEYNDPVPLVAPGEWGFDRYGTTKILPYREGCYDGTYREYIDRIRARLNAGYGYNIEGFANYVIVPFNTQNVANHDTQGTVLRKAMRALASTIGDRAAFYNTYQPELMAVIENKLGGEDKNPDFEVYLSNLIDDFIDVKVPLFVVRHPNLLLTLKGNVSTLAEVHEDQDYYVGWMQLMDENYENSLPLVWGDDSYRVFTANCPVDVYVYNSAGKMVASIVDDVPSADEDQPIIVSIDEQGQKVAYLPNGSDYRVMIVAREEGDVSCGVEEVNAESGSTVRATSFETIALGEQDTMQAEVPAISEDEMESVATEGSSTQYSLETDEDEVAIANDICGADAIAEHTYEVATTYDETKGEVRGGGSFVEGSFARLEAVGADGYYLEGFYVDGVKLEATDVQNPDVVRFRVTGDTVVEARFAPKTAVSAPSAASGLVYTGKAQEGVPEGEGYTVEGGAATDAGSHTATVTPGRAYLWDDGTCEPRELSWTIEPADMTSVTLSGTSFAYTGQIQKPSVKSVAAGEAVAKSSDYSVSYSNASSKAAGSYQVTVTGAGNITGSKTLSYKIVQAANKATAAKISVKKTLKAAKVKKKAAKVSLPKVTTKFGTAKWKVTTKDKKGVLKLKGGKVLVKKGAKKGTYTIKLKATVKATKDYKAATTKVVKVKVTVK